MMEHNFKNILSVLLACGVTTMAHAEGLRILASPAPGHMEAFDSSLLGQARTFTHPVMTAPAPHLKAVGVSQGRHLIGVDPAEVDARHPQGTTRTSQDEVTLRCYLLGYSGNAQGSVGVPASTKKSEYASLCNQYVSPCDENQCFGRIFP